MITEELREYARAFHDIWLDSTDQTISFTTGDMPPTFDSIRMDTRFLAIADRIDEECERRQEDVIDEVLGGLMKMTDEKMAENGWVRLPVDADGIPIHIGDMLNPPADCDDYVPLQVTKLMYDEYEGGWFFDGEAGGFTGMVGEHMDVTGWTHRLHEPTVEDVLREFAEKMNENMGMYTGEAIDADEWRQADSKTIAEYAKKLQLREA